MYKSVSLLIFPTLNCSPTLFTASWHLHVVSFYFNGNCTILRWDFRAIKWVKSGKTCNGLWFTKYIKNEKASTKYKKNEKGMTETVVTGCASCTQPFLPCIEFARKAYTFSQIFTFNVMTKWLDWKFKREMDIRLERDQIITYEILYNVVNVWNVLKMVSKYAVDYLE